MTHLRLDDSAPVRRCACGQPGCTRWREDALEAAACTWMQQDDLTAMAERAGEKGDG